MSLLQGVLCGAAAPKHRKKAEGLVSVPALLSSAGLAPLQWLRDGVDKWQAALALVCAEEGSARAAAQSAIALMPLSLVDSTRETATSSECAGLLASWYVVASLCVLLC